MTPAFLGIQEPSLLACLEMCDTENMGSADLNCYGVVYTPDVNVSEGVTCDLKDQVCAVSFRPFMLDVWMAISFLSLS